MAEGFLSNMQGKDTVDVMHVVLSLQSARVLELTELASE